jgi:putative FmdB family regulatory protein
MPTYEYACTKCGHHFEHFQSMKDEPLKKCPKCGKRALKRLVGAGAGLIFKGSGFYITDYKAKPAEKAASGEKTPTATSSSDPVQPVKGRPAELKESKPAPAPAKTGDAAKKK